MFICRETASGSEGLPVRSCPEASAPALGCLDSRTSKILEPLLDRSLVRVQGLVEGVSHGKGNLESNFLVYLNIYTNRTTIQKIGEYLAANRVYLQHPFSPVPDIPYENPHFLTKPGTMLTTSSFCTSPTISDTLDASKVQDKLKVDGNFADTLICMGSIQSQGDLDRLLDSVECQPQVFQQVEQSLSITTKLLP